MVSVDEEETTSLFQEEDMLGSRRAVDAKEATKVPVKM
jgi:hypothetical protein